MKIACIGWGSLIWRPKGLKIQNHWFEDGPVLPVEFTRISSDNRVTLIIDNQATTVRTLWALMTCGDLDEAKKSLIDREGVKKDSLIHSISKNDETKDEIHLVIKNWLKEKDIDCAIWTGLSFSKKTDNKRPSRDKIVDHLKKLNAIECRHAEEYIRKAPIQIDTDYRQQIEVELGWTPIENKGYLQNHLSKRQKIHWSRCYRHYKLFRKRRRVTYREGLYT